LLLYRFVDPQAADLDDTVPRLIGLINHHTVPRLIGLINQ
jgi:hypothetical protein